MNFTVLEGVSKVSERACERSERSAAERPSGPLKSRLSLTRNTPLIAENMIQRVDGAPQASICKVQTTVWNIDLICIMLNYDVMNYDNDCFRIWFENPLKLLVIVGKNISSNAFNLFTKEIFKSSSSYVCMTLPKKVCMKANIDVKKQTTSQNLIFQFTKAIL